MAPRIKKKAVVITAREETRLTTVASPTVPGAVEVLEFVPGILDRASGRQRLLYEQRMAAEKYKEAFESLVGARSMQWESNVQMPRGPRISPAIPLMDASGILAQANIVVGMPDADILKLHLGMEYTMKQTASFMLDRLANDKDAEYMGRRYRDSLTRLAAFWFRDRNKGGKTPLFYRGFNEWTADSEVVEGGSTAHASVGKVDIRRRS